MSNRGKMMENETLVTVRRADVERLETIERAARRLAYIVRKSVNAGPISNDPTSEGQAWRALRDALGEGVKPEEQSLAESIGLGVGGRGVAEY